MSKPKTVREYNDRVICPSHILSGKEFRRQKRKEATKKGNLSYLIKSFK